MAGLTIFTVLIVSAVVCLALPNYRIELEEDVVRGRRGMSLEEVVDFVKRSSDPYMMLPVDDVEMAKKAVEDALQAHATLQKQKKFAECTQLECHPVTMGGKDYVQCVRVAANC